PSAASPAGREMPRPSVIGMRPWRACRVRPGSLGVAAGHGLAAPWRWSVWWAKSRSHARDATWTSARSKSSQQLARLSTLRAPDDFLRAPMVNHGAAIAMLGDEH